MHLVQGLTADRNLLTQAIASKRMLPPVGFVTHFVSRTGSPAQQLIHYVNSISGRVNLVFITPGGGTPLDPDNMHDDFPEIEGSVQNLNGPSRVMRLSRIATYIVPLVQGNVWANRAMIDTARAGGGYAYFTGIRTALNEITATGSDYYTLSYIPTNPNWNGKFRNIKVNIADYPQPPPPETLSTLWSEALGWTERQKSKIIYRPGYFARSIPQAPGLVPPAPSTGASTRRAISYSPKDAPNNVRAATAAVLIRAMDFGTLAPDQLNFTIVTTPLPQEVKLKAGSPLPKDNFLTEPFRTDAYRDIHVHYWIDPQDLTFTSNPKGVFSDDLHFVVVVYRDDGVTANSLSTTSHLQFSAQQLNDPMSDGITFDQTIAVPVAGNPLPGNFFLRVGISEASTGRVGAIEIPAEWIKLQPSDHIATTPSTIAP